jgi:hypothetical protein
MFGARDLCNQVSDVCFQPPKTVYVQRRDDIYPHDLCSKTAGYLLDRKVGHWPHPAGTIEENGLSELLLCGDLRIQFTAVALRCSLILDREVATPVAR